MKHSGQDPNIGVNTLRNPRGDEVPEHIELAHSTED
jgi:isobutyryl-CoA mutase